MEKELNPIEVGLARANVGLMIFLIVIGYLHVFTSDGVFVAWAIWAVCVMASIGYCKYLKKKILDRIESGSWIRWMQREK